MTALSTPLNIMRIIRRCTNEFTSLNVAIEQLMSLAYTSAASLAGDAGTGTALRRIRGGLSARRQSNTINKYQRKSKTVNTCNGLDGSQKRHNAQKSRFDRCVNRNFRGLRMVAFTVSPKMVNTFSRPSASPASGVVRTRCASLADSTCCLPLRMRHGDGSMPMACLARMARARHGRGFRVRVQFRRKTTQLYAN